MAKFIFNSILLLFALHTQAVTNNKCANLFSQTILSQTETLQPEQVRNLELLKNQSRLDRNNFTTARDLQDYVSYLKLADILPNMDPKKRWLDAGAGRARAQLQFLDLKTKKSESPPEMVALSYKKPWFVTSKKASFKYLDGHFIEDYKPSELGRFDLITDLYGPFSYSKNPIAVLNQYLELLNLQGTLRIFSSSMTSGIWVGGQLISLEQWILQKMSTPQAKAIFETGAKNGLISVRRINHSSLLLPQIHMILFSAETPPVRKYMTDTSSDY